MECTYFGYDTVAQIGSGADMRKNAKKIDLLIALGMNVLILFIYTQFFALVPESNDDLAMSYFVEGVYGQYSEYLIFENVLWGKFLVFMNQLIPAVKWYNVLMFAMVFVAFCEMTYAIIRAQGRKLGIAVSSIMLLFCGYHSYVLFQFSRVTAIATIGGMIMLFYALERAEGNMERKFCLIAGGLLSVWASMMRFQVFGLCVVLVGGAFGFYRLYMILREKREGWIKQIVTYLAVFGTVGVVSLALYIVDWAHYETNEEWKYYKEYNEVRADLWDTGFPDYYENYELYQSLGISENDFIYYLHWEMDEEVLTLDTLKTIQAAKTERTFDIKEFLTLFPSAYVPMSVFTVFVVLAFVTIALNKKNIYFVVYEFIGVMAFEALFFWMNRYGVERIDSGMWMAASITLMYAMSDDIKNITVNTWRWTIAVVGIAATLNFSYLSDYTNPYMGRIGTTKAVYEVISQDKEHLYVMLTKGPEIYHAYNFWEPSGEGDLSNVYNAYGWEYNINLKHDILENYGISNIYRDGVDNEKVYFVPGAQAERLILYVQENYYPDAQLVYEAEIMGYPVWSIKTGE